MELQEALKPGKVILELLVQRRNILPEVAVTGDGGVFPENVPSRVPLVPVPS